MELLSHLNPTDQPLLRVINDRWPVQFMSEYARFYHEYHRNSYFIVYDSGLKAYMPLRFFNYKLFKPAQIFFAPHRDGKEIPKEEQLEFYNKLLSTLTENGLCDRLIQPQPFSVLGAVPEHSKYCGFGTYIVDLENQSADEILARFHPKYQKAITHSQKHHAEVRLGKNTLDDFYAIYESTMRKASLHVDPYAYFNSHYNILGDQHVLSGVIYDGALPVSGVFIIYSKYGAFLTHAGTSHNSRLYGAAKLLNYEIMKHLKAQGVRQYDFVGVRLQNTNPELEGIFRFKKGFGGDLKEGFLWKKDLVPFKASVYDVLSKFKPGAKNVVDIIDQMNNSSGTQPKIQVND